MEGCAKLSMLAGPGKPHKEFDFVPEGSGELRRSVGERDHSKPAALDTVTETCLEAQHVPGSSGQCP